MTSRRSSLKVTPGLESLDARVVPSVAHFSHAQIVAIRAELRAARHASAHTIAHIRAQAARAAAARPLVVLPAIPATVSTSTATTGRISSPMTVIVRSAPVSQTAFAAPSIQTSSSAVPASTTGTFNVSATPNVTNLAATNAATTNTGATTTPTPPNVDSALGGIFQAFQASGASGVASSPLAHAVDVQGSNVEINAHWNGSGSFGGYVSALTALGFKVQTSDSQFGLVNGLLPIDQLVAAAQLPQTASLTAGFRPRIA